jgi:hypothetical protein
MRNKKALLAALHRRLLIDRAILRKLNIPRTRLPIMKQWVDRKSLTVMDEAANYHARIPQYLKAVRVGGVNSIRAGYAIGTFHGICMVSREVLQEKRRGGRIVAKVL